DGHGAARAAVHSRVDARVGSVGLAARVSSARALAGAAAAARHAALAAAARRAAPSTRTGARVDAADRVVLRVAPDATAAPAVLIAGAVFRGAALVAAFAVVTRRRLGAVVGVAGGLRRRHARRPGLRVRVQATRAVRAIRVRGARLAARREEADLAA